MYYEIGSKIKTLRLKQNMTLKDLSTKTGLSSSFISQLERGLTTIAIDSLDSISIALNVPIGSFFQTSLEAQKSTPITRRHERILMMANLSNTSYALSNDFNTKKMFPCLYELHPQLINEPAELYSHRGEKFIYVLYGILTVNLNAEFHYLQPGDSLHIRSDFPHNIQNDTSDIVTFISVCIPDENGDLIRQEI